MWVDLDGCLREEALDLKMRIENTESKAWMEWTFHREVKAQRSHQRSQYSEMNSIRSVRIPIRVARRVPEGIAVVFRDFCSSDSHNLRRRSGEHVAEIATRQWLGAQRYRLGVRGSRLARLSQAATPDRLRRGWRFEDSAIRGFGDSRIRRFGDSRFGDSRFEDQIQDQ